MASGSEESFSVVNASELSGSDSQHSRDLEAQSQEKRVVKPESALEDPERADDVLVEYTVGAIGPFISRFGFGGMCGFCAGYAIKQASKVAALLFGLTFVGLQGLQYAGYIEIKWQKIKKDSIRLVDSDGSGVVGVKDIKHYMRNFLAILRFHGPSATGLSAGLYYGFYKG